MDQKRIFKIVEMPLGSDGVWGMGIGKYIRYYGTSVTHSDQEMREQMRQICQDHANVVFEFPDDAMAQVQPNHQGQWQEVSMGELKRDLLENME